LRLNGEPNPEFRPITENPEPEKKNGKRRSSSAKNPTFGKKAKMSEEIEVPSGLFEPKLELEFNEEESIGPSHDDVNQPVYFVVPDSTDSSEPEDQTSHVDLLKGKNSNKISPNMKKLEEIFFFFFVELLIIPLS
jgi:hypothetical protein